jgi:hypothetical protein
LNLNVFDEFFFSNLCNCKAKKQRSIIYENTRIVFKLTSGTEHLLLVRGIRFAEKIYEVEALPDLGQNLS